MGLNLKDALQTFYAESRALLHDMEDALLRLEDAIDDTDALNAVFRAAHTIKGSAGLFGLNAIVSFTHEAESVLDLARASHLPVDGQLCGLLLLCKDHLELLLQKVESGEDLAPDAVEHGAFLIARLQQLHGVEPARGASTLSEALQEVRDGPHEADRPLSDGDCWHISLRFDTEVLRNGMDPASFVRYLGTFGRVVRVVTVMDGMPALLQLDPECCYLGFELQFRSDCDKAAIEAAFEFVRDDCQLRILPPGSRVADYIRLINELPEDSIRLGELLVLCGAVTQRELDEALQGQQQNVGTNSPLGQILIEEQVVRKEVVDAALTRQNEVRARQSQEAMFIRVHADKLDSLINQVGELVIAGAGAGLLAQRSKDAGLLEALSLMSRLIEDVRDSAMRLRMIEIGETFNRFRRVVRDVSKELGKDISLTISGAETELDKSVVERIGDPLTHLLRNAMDHGIEPVDVRAARRKPAGATVALKAYHEGGSVVIEVSDDGGGLDRERILAKATARGLVPADREMSDAAVWNMIFEPGFSTAEQVSNLSGRGVGMDVVKRGIEALRGSIEIESHEGLGATFRIRLPLTMAIIDGFLMAVGDTHFVVPLDAVLECVEIEPSTADAGRDYVDLRGEVLPLLRLRQHFAVPGAASRRQNVVVVHMGTRKAGLVVDKLRGEFQAVIKPMGKLFAHVHGLAGSTILGSGEVALMLDVPALLDQAAQAKNGSAWRPAEASH